jgi:hypothetical protein
MTTDPPGWTWGSVTEKCVCAHTHTRGRVAGDRYRTSGGRFRMDLWSVLRNDVVTLVAVSQFGDLRAIPILYHRVVADDAGDMSHDSRRTCSCYNCKQLVPRMSLNRRNGDGKLRIRWPMPNDGNVVSRSSTVPRSHPLKIFAFIHTSVEIPAVHSSPLSTQAGHGTPIIKRRNRCHTTAAGMCPTDTQQPVPRVGVRRKLGRKYR